MAHGRPSILALVDYYPPAYRAGGPTRSVPGIVERLAGAFRFKIITRNKDLGVPQPLAGISPNRWVAAGSAECLYLSPAQSWPGGLWRAIRRVEYDVLYLNSIFSLGFTLWPLLLRRARLLRRAGLVISPRGELDKGALGLKRRRKGLYLRVVRQLGLVDDAVWHATSPDEAARVRAEFGAHLRIVVASAMPMAVAATTARPTKEAGTLGLLFLSRISKKKNLHFAIEALHGAKGKIRFEVVGPIEDRRYWQHCQRAARSLPANVTFEYSGVAGPGEVPEVLGRNHLFVLPTLGENFGHAIVESLLAGCPVLISDQTPWHDLTIRRAGWDLPLAEVAGFRRVIEQCVGMDADEFEEWSRGARRLGGEISSNAETVAAYVSLFHAALGA